MIGHFINKSKFATALLILLFLSSTIFALSIQPAQAQPAAQQPSVSIPSGSTASRDAETIARLSFRPHTVGIGQTVLVNTWIESVFLAANYQFFDAYQVTITKPDGTKDVVVKDSYVADTTAWFEFNPNQVGTYSLKLDFLGQYFPNGTYYNGVNYPNTTAIGPYTLLSSFGAPQLLPSIYYKPSSDGPYTLTVQEQQVESWPASPLPTDYWTRPATTMNREWWPILGNYPGTGVVGGGPTWPADTNPYAQVRYAYEPYVQGPKSAHVVWKQAYNIGGLIGGTMGTNTIWASAQVIYGHPTIIYSGRAYWTTTKVINGNATSVWECYDIRTGEIYWDRYPVQYPPTMISYDPGLPEVEGAQPHLYTVYLVYIGNGYLIKYDPWTGAIVTQSSIAPLTAGYMYADPYVLSVYNQGNTSNPNYRLVNWTTRGTATTLDSTRIVSNISWPISSLPGSSGTSFGPAPQSTPLIDYEAGLAVSASATVITSYSITTGQMVCNISTGMAYATEGTPALADHGKLAQRYNDGHWHCWDLRTGQALWTSELSSAPWGTFGTYGSASYGGMIMSNQFDSVTALNWTNGKIVWSLYDPAASPYETPYTAENMTVNPWHTCGMIADGVYYTMNAEHSADEPIKRGWCMHAINITTGEDLWKLPGTQSGSTDGSRVFQGAVSDGYLAYSDAYDCIEYVVGKGLSQTTVTAPDTVNTQGQGIVIKGTVLDQSPAQPGTACVSKDSMTVQMEHIHWQMPIAGIYGNETIIGVPVSIDAVDPNGNNIHIATVTSDGYSGTFGYTWTPEIVGQYTITATFAGDDSYGSSFATTYASVSEAPVVTTAPTPTPVAQTPYEMYTIGMGVAIIIAIALVGLLLLRKHA
jgi:hypothetical protein